MRTEGASFVSLIDAVRFTDKCEMNETGEALVLPAVGSLNMPVSSTDGFPPRNI